MKSRDSALRGNNSNRESTGTESDLIARMLTGMEGLDARILLGAGDDAAVFKNKQTAVSTDLTIEDIHFRRDWIDLHEVGFRAVMSAISDLAAMAADPFGVLISLALPQKESRDILEGLTTGIQEAVRKVGASLIGGDLSSSPGPIVIDVTVLGEIKDLVTRTGISKGDEIWVTGVLGGAAGAVKIWLSGGNPSMDLRNAFTRTPSRVLEARWLVENAGIRTMIDISDGLLRDVNHLADASDVRIVIESNEIPIHPGLESDIALSLGMSGGEDYELCLVCEKGILNPLVNVFEEKFGVRLTRVGYVEEGSGIEIKGSYTGSSNGILGFDHFLI